MASEIETRPDRERDEMRPLAIELDTAPYAEGSCTIRMGDTRVLCAATVSEDVPPWRAPSGKGWVTAEYAMLPRATHTRTPRERRGAKGRTQEIQRLIGRSLRGVCDLAALGSLLVTVDCDVLQADGGTRTASITGGWIALARALEGLRDEGRVDAPVILDHVAAVSVGLVGDVPCLDLDYAEDSSAQVDMNVVALGSGDLVEVQGTAEGRPFQRAELDAMLDLALGGIRTLVDEQRRILA